MHSIPAATDPSSFIPSQIVIDDAHFMEIYVRPITNKLMFVSYFILLFWWV